MTIDAPAPAGPDERTSDAERVRALAELDALAVPPRRDLVALVDLAALLSGMPMATINLVTDTEQHQVATYGFDASVCRREDSMCARTLDEAGAGGRATTRRSTSASATTRSSPASSGGCASTPRSG